MITDFKGGGREMPCGKLGLRGPIIIQFMQHRIITVEQAGIGDSMKM